MKNLTSRSTRYIILLLSFICFTSCGYELRNPSSSLSDIQFRIISENSELNKEFEKQIKQRNIILQELDEDDEDGEEDEEMEDD